MQLDRKVYNVNTTNVIKRDINIQYTNKYSVIIRKQLR